MAKPLFGCALLVVLPVVASAVTMEMVTVCDPGNVPDPLNTNTVPGIGSVAYSYQIGKYEVRNSEYVEFLNSVAASDTYGLYNTSMGSDARGGITRAGTSGSYSYSVKVGYADKPVVCVSFYNAARFANWLENGQPNGDQGVDTTETGSYTLFTDGTQSTHVSDRGPNATWVIPTENEWYKAAYFDAGSSAPPDNYWFYPTRSDSTPSNDLNNPDPGNSANFYQSGFTVGGPVYLTDVGAFSNSGSFYGTFDQGGNLWEWNEAVIIVSGEVGDIYTNRCLRGGVWQSTGDYLQSPLQYSDTPGAMSQTIGFRIAAIPKTPVLTMREVLAGAASLVLDGSVGLSHLIEVSDTLTNWQPWAAVTLSNHSWTTNFTLDPNQPRLFWRAQRAQ